MSDHCLLVDRGLAHGACHGITRVREQPTSDGPLWRLALRLARHFLAYYFYISELDLIGLLDVQHLENSPDPLGFSRADELTQAVGKIGAGMLWRPSLTVDFDPDTVYLRYSF